MKVYIVMYNREDVRSGLKTLDIDSVWGNPTKADNRKREINGTLRIRDVQESGHWELDPVTGRAVEIKEGDHEY